MSKTANLGLPMPDEAATVEDEFRRLQQLWPVVDTILHALQTAVAGKADSSHTHSMDQVSGLVAALQGKMSAGKTFKLNELVDVIGALEAGNGYVLAKNADGKFTFASPASLLGAHQHVVSDIVGLLEALNDRVLKSGDTMTGPLKVSRLNVDGPAGTYREVYFNTGGSPRWIANANETAEGAGNSGSDFALARCDNAGKYISNVLLVDRSTGEAALMERINAFKGMKSYGEIVTTSMNGYRIVSGRYGAMWRFDGLAYYLLFTAPDDQYGSWNGLRPIAVEAETGRVRIGNGLSISHGTLLFDGTGAELLTDGNIVFKQAMTVFGPKLSDGLSAALSYGQKWQDVKGQRAVNTVYQNTTGKPIYVSLRVNVGGATGYAFQVSDDGSTFVDVGLSFYDATTGGPQSQIASGGPFRIPPGHRYRLTGGGFDLWAELR